MQLNIDSRAVRRHVDLLNALHRSAFPVAVRNTLNSAAFDVKTSTMPKEAKDAFVQRKPNFFKANSKVLPAKGFTISKMEATVGFKPKNGNDKSVDDLEQQEHGGEIGGKAFIPMKTARIGKSDKKSVRPVNRVEEFNKRIIDARKVRFKAADRHKSQKFIRAAFMAAKLWGGQGMVLSNKRADGKRTLSRIDEIWGSTRRKGESSSRTLLIKRTPLYSYEKGRKVHVDKKNFMKRASLEAGLQLNRHFEKHAKDQIAKYRNR